MRLRDYLATGYMFFLLIWFGGWGWFVANYGVTPLEALGIGTATGVFLGSFKDMWQFYFRKRPADERLPNN